MLLSDFFLKKIEALVADLKDLMKLLARVFLIYVFNISNST